MLDAIVSHRQKFDFQAERNSNVMTLGMFTTQIRYSTDAVNERRSRLARQAAATKGAATSPCKLAEVQGPGVVQLAALFASYMLSTGVINPSDLVGIFGSCSEDLDGERIFATVRLSVFLLRPNHVDTGASLWETSTSDAIAMHELAENLKNVLDPSMLATLFQLDGDAMATTTCTLGEVAVLAHLSAHEIRRTILDAKMLHTGKQHTQSTSSTVTTSSSNMPSSTTTSEAPPTTRTISMSAPQPPPPGAPASLSTSSTPPANDRGCSGQTLLGLVVFEGSADDNTRGISKASGLQMEAAAVADQINSMLYSFVGTTSEVSPVTCASGAPGMLVVTLYISALAPKKACVLANEILADALDGQNKVFSLNNQLFRAVAFIGMDCIIEANEAEGAPPASFTELTGQTPVSTPASTSTSTPTSSSPPPAIDPSSSSSSNSIGGGEGGGNTQQQEETVPSDSRGYQVQDELTNSTADVFKLAEATIPIIAGSAVLCAIAVLLFLTWVCRRRKERSPWDKDPTYEAIDGLGVDDFPRLGHQNDMATNSNALHNTPSVFYEDEWFPGGASCGSDSAGTHITDASAMFGVNELGAHREEINSNARKYYGPNSADHSHNRSGGGTNKSKRPLLPARWTAGNRSRGESSLQLRPGGGNIYSHRPAYSVYESQYAELGGKSTMADDPRRRHSPKFSANGMMDDAASEMSDNTVWTSSTDDVGVLQLGKANIGLFEQTERSILNDIADSTGIIQGLRDQQESRQKKPTGMSRPNDRTAAKSRGRRDGDGDGDGSFNGRPPSYDVTFGFQAHAFHELTGRGQEGQVLVLDDGENLAADSDNYSDRAWAGDGNGGVQRAQRPVQQQHGLQLQQHDEAMRMLEKTADTINVVRKRGSAAQGLGGLRRSPAPVYTFDAHGGGSSSPDHDFLDGHDHVFSHGGSQMAKTMLSTGIRSSADRPGADSVNNAVPAAVDHQAARARGSEKDEQRKCSSSSTDSAGTADLSPWLRASGKEDQQQSIGGGGSSSISLSRNQRARTARRVKKKMGELDLIITSMTLGGGGDAFAGDFEM